MYFLYVVYQTLSIFYTIVEYAFLIRAVLSWFMNEEGLIYSLCVVLTEPIIVPMRCILERFHLFEDLPIDMSFFFSCILIYILHFALPTVTL